MTHPCSPLPLPPTSPSSPHYRPSLKRWSRSSTYQKILERDEDDWCNGGMGVPLIAVDSGLGSSINEKVAQVTRPQTGTGSSKRRSRWSILSIGSMNGNGGAANDPFVDPVANVGAVGNDAAQTRKRKRWSNSVGSATTTVVGGVRSSIARFTGYESAGSGNIGVSQSRFGDSDEEDRVQRRKRRIKRVMRGAMQSFAGFSYGMVGGRDAFKWEDVKDDQHRENYLGHSLMARKASLTKNKDLSWYAKGDTSQAATDAANARAEEIRRIKEAENDALSEALGFPVQPRLRDNQLAGQKEVDKALKETADGDEEGGKGVGFGTFLGANANRDDNDEIMRGHAGDVGGLEEVLGTGMSEDGEVAAVIEMVLGDTDTIIARIDGEIGTLTEELAAARDRDPGIGMNIVREMTTGEIITEKDNP
ncbi:MAG: hypothetical protein Q9202_004965 [Teloschistes flavicans]